MNIQIPGQQSPLNPMGNSPMNQQLQMIQMLISLMMRAMSQLQGQVQGPGQNQGQGLMPSGNPGFGNRAGACPAGHARMGNTSTRNTPSPNLPGFGSFGGNGNSSPGSLAPSSGAPRSHDSYVPQGADQSNQIGNLGSGSGSDAVRWALDREGISETNNPDAVREISRGRWQAWCADFVSQAYANSPGGSPFGHQSSVAGILSWGRENNRFFDASAAQAEPSMLRVGDVAVWKSSGRSHVGLVTGVNENGTFNTIEGNTSDAVRRRTHSFGGGLTGFVRPRG